MFIVKESDIDKAFEWLIMIVGIILAILNQYPEYFYAITTQPSRSFPLRVAIGVIPPMVVTTLIWLIGKLSSRNLTQALVKLIAWMCLIGIMGINLIFYFVGVMVASGKTIEEVRIILSAPIVLGFFFFIPIFIHYVITPKYRDVYPNVSFLKSKTRLLIIYTITDILLIFLLVGTH